MASAKATEIFNCTPKEFYDLVMDFEKYPEFLNEVKKVKILKRGASDLEAEYTVSVLKTFTYKIKAQFKEPNKTEKGSVSFHYTEGDVFKTMKGSWSIQTEGTAKCKVEYNVEATFGLLVPGAIEKTLVSVNLPIMMTSFKNRVKKIYGK